MHGMCINIKNTYIILATFCLCCTVTDYRIMKPSLDSRVRINCPTSKQWNIQTGILTIRSFLSFYRIYKDAWKIEQKGFHKEFHICCLLLSAAALGFVKLGRDKRPKKRKCWYEGVTRPCITTASSFLLEIKSWTLNTATGAKAWHTGKNFTTTNHILNILFRKPLFNFVNYVFILLCMFRSGYSVSLCCSVYCLYVNVYCTTATECQHNCT